jgi:tRNA (guanine-N7-)-methyltransferase
MTEPERRTRATEAFFGRRKGKPLRDLQAEKLKTLLPAFLIDLQAAPPASLDGLFPVAVAVERLRLEIGFGGGEHLIHRAQ